MKASDYKIGDTCLFYHSATGKTEEITIDDDDLEMIKRYENSTFDELWYIPLEK